jgi:hypothetical protein
MAVHTSREVGSSCGQRLDLRPSVGHGHRMRQCCCRRASNLMRIVTRKMSRRERRFSSLAGVAIAVCFVAYGLHYVVSDNFGSSLRIIWLVAIGLAVCFETISRIFRYRDRARHDR